MQADDFTLSLLKDNISYTNIQFLIYFIQIFNSEHMKPTYNRTIFQ